MTKLTHLEEIILNILQDHKGRHSPVTARDLEKMTLSSSRKIRKTISDLVIKHNIPIASSVHHPYGFYLVTEKEEALQCLKQYWSRVREVTKRANMLTKAVEDRFGIEYQKEFDF
ncbi:hypothetical protein ACFL2G_04770 [Candidatus Omnitrophota bacterium]